MTDWKFKTRNATRKEPTSYNLNILILAFGGIFLMFLRWCFQKPHLKNTTSIKNGRSMCYVGTWCFESSVEFFILQVLCRYETRATLTPVKVAYVVCRTWRIWTICRSVNFTFHTPSPLCSRSESYHRLLPLSSDIILRTTYFWIMELAVYVTWLFYIILQVTVRGFSHHVSLRQLHKSIRPQTVVFSIPSTESTESANSEENTDDEDEDFAEMKREIELMLASSTDSKSPLNPISVTSVEEVGKYNKVIAVASALLGSFLFVFQHSQPVSGVALMHAMERDSVDINVRWKWDEMPFL